MATKGFPRAVVLVLVTTIAGLLLVVYYMLSQHRPLRVSDILTGQQQASRSNHDLPSGRAVVGEDLYLRVRVLCLVPTSSRNLQRNAATIRDTWGRRCNKIVFFSDKNDTKFPAIALRELHQREGMDMLTTKMRAAFTYVHDRHLSEADWFLKADDDTYVIVDNLRFLLSHHDAGAPVYFGHHFRKYGDQGYMSGGAGYVLSRTALKRLVEEGYRQAAPRCRRWGGAEDVALGQCLEAVGVRTGLSMDAENRQTFHPFNLLTHLSGSYPRWYYDYSKYKVTQGADCCSDFSISYHFVEPNVMRMMDHLLYKTQVYGLHQGAPQRTVFRHPGGH